MLVETPLPWRPWALKRIPAHWAAISPRTSGRRERVRDATDPFNAVLNYCYTLLEVETRIACEAVGLDPDLGLLHTDDRLRESFIYDLLEPLRARPTSGRWNCCTRRSCIRRCSTNCATGLYGSIPI